MSDLRANLQTDLVLALKSGDKVASETVRLIIAAIKNFEIDAYPPGSTGTLTDADVLSVLQKQVKKHRESIAAYTAGNRQDLVSKEQVQLAIVERYAPKELTDEELTQIVDEVVGGGDTNFGNVMKHVISKVGGRADGKRISEVVRQKLS